MSSGSRPVMGTAPCHVSTKPWGDPATARPTHGETTRSAPARGRSALLACIGEIATTPRWPPLCRRPVVGPCPTSNQGTHRTTDTRSSLGCRGCSPTRRTIRNGRPQWTPWPAARTLARSRSGSWLEAWQGGNKEGTRERGTCATCNCGLVWCGLVWSGLLWTGQEFHKHNTMTPLITYVITTNYE